jgi:predicted RecB family nuclease
MAEKDTRKITSKLVEAYTQCERKAFLLLQGRIEGSEHEYSKILKKRATENRLRFENFTEVGSKVIFYEADDTPLVVVRNDCLIADCDILLKSDSESPALKTDFLYEPYLFTGTYSVLREQKLQLAFAGYAASATRRPRPSNGFIVTLDDKKHRINLQPLYSTIESAVDGLRKMINVLESDPPKLILNTHCPICPFRDHCRREAENNDNLSMLVKMTPKVIRRYEKKGIFTIKQLSYAFNPRRRRKKSLAASHIFNFELQALALRTKKIYLHETPLIPTNQVELFLDIEGIPDQNFNYLIGLIAVNGDTIKAYSFWADARDDESTIFQNFLAVAETYGNAPIYHYGNYELSAFNQIKKLYELKMLAVEKRLVNVNSFIYGKVYFPSKSNGLKELGALVGATWNSPEASGLQSLVWRYQWEESRDARLKDKLMRYNQDDCQALQRLLDELRNIGKVAMSRNDIEFALSPKQVSTEEGHLIHTQLEEIIVSAYEEKYKWNRIRLRRVQDNAEEGRKKPPRQLPIAARNIPATGGRTISVPRKRRCLCEHRTALTASDEMAEHAIIELFFTKSGCKKSILRYVGRKADCPTCGRCHFPPAIQRLQSQIFGHQFQSWVVNQRIALRLPIKSISMQVEDLFNEQLSGATIDHFIQCFSKIYASSQKILLTKIIQSPVVHADETKLNIHGTNQYAWVLTDGSRAIFWLTQTRETTVLQELLNDYEGILVSDFYGGYDAFDCRQQKCLVHLLRDINEDLWRNPFNQEYEKFVAKVSNLFAPIFDDVYKYGLKKRHLGKHAKAVGRFYEQTISVHSTCELIEKYCKRFERYRESLFTFLEGDGIPWNNNMAERAIRHLAIQRKISGYFTKAGAERYLILLGVAQSCRFQKKSFLRFLLSGEIDVDKFNEKKQPPRNAKANI